MRKLLLNQLKLIAKENLVMPISAIWAKMSAQKSEARSQTFVHPRIPFTRIGPNQMKASTTGELWLSAYSPFKNDFWLIN